MPSPFPGMNPYLEQPASWHDFHTDYLTTLRAQLSRGAGEHYIVRVEEQMYIHDLPDDDERDFLGRADVGVAWRGHGSHGSPHPAEEEGGVATLAEPRRARLLPEVDIQRVRRLEIRERDGRELVTIIELLSPINKRQGADREAYIGKRKSLLHSPVHLVEIDLLRGGLAMPLEEMPDCDYSILVSRYEERPEVDVWPVRLRAPLPTIPIPLRSPDADVPLDLMAALHRTYDDARYELYIYDGQPRPPLHPDDEAWARGVVKAAAA